MPETPMKPTMDIGNSGYSGEMLHLYEGECNDQFDKFGSEQGCVLGLPVQQLHNSTPAFSSKLHQPTMDISIVHDFWELQGDHNTPFNPTSQASSVEININVKLVEVPNIKLLLNSMQSKKRKCHANLFRSTTSVPK